MPANPELRLKVIDCIARGLSPSETIKATGISNGGYHKLKKNPAVMSEVERRKKELEEKNSKPKSAAKSVDRPAVSVAVEVVGEKTGSTMGRPSLLTDAKRNEIVRIVRDEGLSVTAAAPRVGISPFTANEWMRRGEGRDSAGRPCTDDYAQFATAVREAEAIFEGRLLRPLTYSAIQPPDSRTKRSDENAQWILQRRFPARYGQTQNVNVQVESKVTEAKVAFIESVFAAVAESPRIPEEWKPVFYEVVAGVSGDSGELVEQP
jgi:transposase-like protein